MSYKALKKLLIWERKQQKKVGCPLPTATKMAEIEVEVETVPSLLIPCASCNRTFRPDVLSKHEKVCQKTLMRKRRVFDSAKQRIAGTDIAQFVQNPVPKTGKKPPSPVKDVPPSKWKERHKELANTVTSTKHKKIESVKPSENEQCPYCDRTFGHKSYDRHVEWCKEQQHKARNNSEEVVKAKERLEARTKYQAPLMKSQRTVTKEKFSPTKCPDRYSPPVRDGGNRKIGKEFSSTPVIRKLERASTHIQRTSKYSNTRSNSPSIRRRNSSVSSVDRKSASSEYEMEMSETIKRRPKLNEGSNKPQLSQRDLDKYDPFVSAELQMMELLKNQDSANLQSVHVMSEPSFEMSTESSAFSPIVNSKALNSPELVSSPPASSSKPSKLLSLSTLSLCSTVSIDSLDFNMNPRVRRSASATRAKPSKLNMHNLLFGNENQNQNDNNNGGNGIMMGEKEQEDLAVCEAELLESMLEFEKLLNSTPPPQSNDSSPAKPPIDSAYSSLSRRSPGDNGQTGDADDCSRFCHECGGRYPVPSAKFCCLCGVRRLAMS